MELDLAQQRLQADSLLDFLPADRLFAVRNLVEPFSLTLAMAPVEEEQITEEMSAELREGSAY